MKNLTTLILLALLVAGIRVEAQNGPIIPCDLVDLAGQTLGRSPVIQRQRLQIDQANANFQQARSAFDFNLRAGLGVDYDRSDLFQADPRFALANSMIQSNNFRSFGGLQRTFRNGLLASVDLDYTRFANSFPLNDFNEEVGTYFPDNFTNVSLTLSQPLLRGRGRKFTAALERAAAIRVDGARSNLGFISAGEIRSVALSYWQYLTDYRRLNIFQQNEARVRKLLEITEELVKAEKKPAGDLVQIQADLVDKERQTVLARQQLYNSKQNLGRSIGLEEEESIRLGNPLNDFPELD
ncbi:MAG: TolC family protein, partial [Bacteroidota bacterium]